LPKNKNKNITFKKEEMKGAEKLGFVETGCEHVIRQYLVKFGQQERGGHEFMLRDAYEAQLRRHPTIYRPKY
jgi:hypothetical protein